MNLFELAAVLTLDRSGYDSGLNDAQKTAEGFGSKLKGGLATAAKAGAVAISAASTAVVAFGKSSVDAGMTFDSSMSQVAATMGTTVDQIQDLRDFAQEMGSKTAFSASQAADALNYMALAGYDAETSMSMLPNVLNLAAAGGIDLAYASDMITDSQSALGLTLDETSELVDKMAKASSKSNTSVAQLGEAILTVGGTAKTLAGGTTELSTALGILADNGVKGAEGGTALRNIILALSAPTSTATEGLENLGLAWNFAYDEAGKLRGLDEIFEDLNNAMDGLTDQDKTDALNKIFNKVDLKSANALLATSSDRWYELSDAIDHSYANMTSAIQNAGIDWTKYLSEPWIAQFDTMGDAWKNLGDQIKYNLKDQELSVQETADFISSEYSMSMEDALKAVEAVSNELETTTGAAQAMADTQLDNLAGDITLFQSALEGAQIVVSDQLTPTLREFVQFGAQGISEVTEAFKEGGLSGAMEAFGGVLSDGIAMITEMLPTVMEAGAGLIVALVNGLADNIDIIATAAVNIVNTLISTITESGILTKLVGAALSLVKAIASGIAGNIKTITTAVVDVVLAIVEELTNPDTLLGLLDAGLQIIVGLAEGLLAAVPVVLEALPTIIENIVDTLLGAIPMIIQAGIDLFVALVEALPDIITAITAAIPQIITGIVTAVTQSIPQIIQAGVDLLISLVQNLPTIIKNVVAAIPKIIDSVLKAVIGAIPQLIDAGITLFIALIENLPFIISEIVKAVPEIISSLVEAFGGSVEAIADAGKNLITGLWEGIKSMGQWIGDKVSGFFGGIVDGIKDMLGIHSPSTVFAEMGENMALGIGKGFDDEFASIRDDMNNQMDFTASADVNVNKRGTVTGGYETSSGFTSPEKQPLLVVVQLSSGVELGRALIDNIDQAKRADGMAY